MQRKQQAMTTITSSCKPACGSTEGQKLDANKLRYDLIPWDALDEVVKRFTHGAEKYAPDNWKNVPDAVNRYRVALMRHFSAYCQGERDDCDAGGLSHIGAVAWNALVLVWFDLQSSAARGYNGAERK